MIHNLTSVTRLLVRERICFDTVKLLNKYGTFNDNILLQINLNKNYFQEIVMITYRIKLTKIQNLIK